MSSAIIGGCFVALSFFFFGFMFGWWKGYCHGKTINVTYNVPKIEQMIVNGNFIAKESALDTKEGPALRTTAPAQNAQSSTSGMA
jgi:hypothetical protein